MYCWPSLKPIQIVMAARYIRAALRDKLPRQGEKNRAAQPALQAVDRPYRETAGSRSRRSP